MAAAETAKLIASLDLRDNLTKGINSAIASVGRLEQKFSRFGQVGQGFGKIGTGFLVAGIRAATILAAQTGAVAGAIGVMVKEGIAASNVQKIYATAIANSGKVSAQYVDALNAQQTALMNLGGVDDELIKTEQTRLIQMGLTGAQVQKITPLILDFSKATGIDLLTATKLAGKAVQGNVGALSRYGVTIDKAKAKVDPFAATVDALNQKFGGTTQALSGSLDVRLGALRENLANIREEAGIKLLPAITRIVDVAGKDLVPAFGKFIDRILPSLISGVDQFASLLENGGAERGIKQITDALGPMVDMLKIAAEPVKAIVKAFLSLPSQVQGVLIGGFAINKLSGGLIGQGIGQVVGGIAGDLFKRGGSPATPLFVADVTKGLGGGVPVPGGGLGIASKVFLVGEAIGLGLLVEGIRNQIADRSTAQSVELQGQLKTFLSEQGRNLPALQNALAGVDQGIRDIQSNPLNVLVQGEALANLQQMRKDIAAQIAHQNVKTGTQVFGPPTTMQQSPAALQEGRKNLELLAILKRGVGAGFHPTMSAVEATYQRNVLRAAEAQKEQTRKATEAARATTQAVKDGDQSIVTAIRGIKPPSVNVNVTASDIQRAQVKRRSAVKAHGSAHSLVGANEFG